MNERQMLLKKLAAYDFAQLELHIYLDTHPSDKDAIQKANEYKDKADVIRKEYEDKFGPLTKRTSSNGFAWIAGPWPWEVE